MSDFSDTDRPLDNLQNADFLGLDDMPVVSDPKSPLGRLNPVASEPPVDVLAYVQEATAKMKELLNRDQAPARPDLLSLARRFQLMDAVYEELKSVEKIVSDEYDRLRLKEMPDLMIEEDMKTVTYEGIGRVQLGADVYASIPAPKRDEAYAWLRENNSGDLITETVNSSTLKAWCKEKAASGVVLPDCFKVQPYSRISIVKVRGKK